MTKDVAMSEYELARLENIRKNEEFLKSIGLYKDPLAPVPAPDKALKHRKQKRKRDDHTDPDYVDGDDEVIPVRRSSRNSGIVIPSQFPDNSADMTVLKSRRKYNPVKAAEDFFEDLENGSGPFERLPEDGDDQRVVLKPNQIREFIDAENPEHSDLISDTAVKHCAYRSGYMSLQALKNRIKQISTGANKKSHEKLLVVAYTMRAMGLNRLAETAANLLRNRTHIVLPWCTAMQQQQHSDQQDNDNGGGAIKKENENNSCSSSSIGSGNSGGKISGVSVVKTEEQTSTTLKKNKVSIKNKKQATVKVEESNENNEEREKGIVQNEVEISKTVSPRRSKRVAMN